MSRSLDREELGTTASSLLGEQKTGVQGARSWEVTVHVEGEEVLTIGSSMLAGLENIANFEQEIYAAGQNLLSFIGEPPWQLIETAPKDRPILAWCDHEADPYVVPGSNGRQLTLYGAHAEGMSHVPTGLAIVRWGGGFDDRSYEEPNGGHLADWWFEANSDFEIAANPTHWRPAPEPPYVSNALGRESA